MSLIIKHINNGLITPRIAELFSLYIFKCLSESEEQELEKWIKESDENFELFQEATNPDVLQESFEVIGNKIDACRRLQQIKKRIVFEDDPPVRSIYTRWKWIAAASVIFLLGTITAVYLSRYSSTNELLADTETVSRLEYASLKDTIAEGKPGSYVFTTPQTGIYSIELQDGTKVWLRPSSTIGYPRVFEEDERRVTVSGEVFFEVKKDYVNGRRRPFIVELKDKNVSLEVLGTSFLINAYPGDTVVTTTLITGSLNVKAGGESTLLIPGQQIEVGQKEVRVNKLNQSELESSIKWKTAPYFEFKGNLKQILQDIAVHYNVEIEFNGNMPLSNFSCSVNDNASLKDILNALKLNKIKSRVEGRKIIMSSDP